MKSTISRNDLTQIPEKLVVGSQIQQQQPWHAQNPHLPFQLL